MQKTFPVHIDLLAHDGAGEGVYEGKPVRVHGMLPGEEGIVDAYKKHGIFIGNLREITKASPSRKLPDELHHLSCSPWQVMEYATQAGAKHDLLASLFAYYEDAPKPTFVPAEKFYGYRTKVEFSFTDREGDAPRPLALAFHERGGVGGRRLALHDGCLLASERMNRVALAICAKLRDQAIPARDLKSLIVRESKSTGKVIALLFAKNELLEKFNVEDIAELTGFIAFYSTPKSPASVPTKELWRLGESSITEDISGVDIQYSWDSFFQNNIPVFAHALRDMQESVPTQANVLELYSGVGTIGLLLAKSGAKHVHGVEVVQGAVDSAKANALHAGLRNYVAECIPAEKMDARLLEKRDVLVLDPPRAGLHPKVLSMIKEKLPPNIIYLSCNPETQARDYSALSDRYKITRIVGYDFYPNTPHLESLLLLSLRSV